MDCYGSRLSICSCVAVGLDIGIPLLMNVLNHKSLSAS